MVNRVAVNRSLSSYSHVNAIMEEKYYFNCYGFVNHFLKIAAPAAQKELVRMMIELEKKEGIPASFDGIPCPYNIAMTFQRYKLKYWMPIDDMQSVKPGDVMVYLPLEYSPRSSSEDCFDQQTGTHVMIVQNVYQEEEGYFSFSIIDCTRKAHGASDSRYPEHSGIGTSRLYLSHMSENCYILQWSKKGRQHFKRIFVGRLIKS